MAQSLSIGRTVRNLNLTLQNGLEVIRFGGLQTGEEAAPFKIMHTDRMFRLRHYFADQTEDDWPVLLLIPPLMVDTTIYDVSQKVSAVRKLNELGVNTWVVDFGAPEHEEGGMERSLTDHVLAVSKCIDRVAELTGRPVHIAGYSQGGLFCYMVAAYRKCRGIETVTAFGSPVDIAANLPEWLPAEAFQKFAEGFINNVVAPRGLPGWMIGLGFQGLDPAATVRNRIKFLTQLHNREALLPREGQRQFIEGGGFVGYAGPAVAELISMTGAANRLMSGGFDFLGQTVTLADITVPTLVFLSPADAIAPPATVRGIRKAAPLAPLYEVGMTGGHMGLVSSSAANEIAWPAMRDWLVWHDEQGGKPKAKPASIQPWNDRWEDEDTDASASQLVDSLSLAAEMVAEIGGNIGRSARNSARTLKGLADEAREQLPQMMRLGSIRPATRVSMAQLLAEQGSRAPGNVAFLFDDRSYSFAAVNERIDNVVRGLISIGVRRGEHVGVLMSTRPSALTLIAAINRIGAVAVILRPGNDIEQEAALGFARRLITDPENAKRAVKALDLPIFVLGGGGGHRDLGDKVTDMEQIDPAKVTLPGWYKPNPARARELAFVLFTGSGERTKANRITNGRWALSAFGTASAASITSLDTVFGTTIHYHPSGLLTTFGCAIAGGARLALTDSFDPITFWDEVRRYGATIVSYTWTSLHEVVNSPRHPLEKDSPVRLLIGSGMPVSLWHRVHERFAPATVVEFYASTEGEAVLVNVDGHPVGAKGRPLPGGARVKLAACDLESGRLTENADGFAQEATEGDVGMLLAACGGGTQQTGVLRGLFAPDDAWLPTGDLFRRIDGEYWLVGNINQLIHTPDGPVATTPIEDALGHLDSTDLVVAWNEKNQPMAAVTLVKGAQLQAGELDAALAELPTHAKPRIIRVIKSIPVTSWYRLKPPGGKAGKRFMLDEDSARYREE